MIKPAVLAALLGCSLAHVSDHWAVIVAGSSGFWNYRHQADTCHAYQIMKKNGIPDDHIIHMSFDDVANDSENPFPGKLFNKPTAAGVKGVDVYDGCKIDYSGNDVTAENVLKVLKGDCTAPGPVLKSTKDSKVFFYFADHGAPGLIGMPVGDYLYADDFNKALNYMHTNSMYNQMVVYMESCESGSMFENILKDNINIYALSAANASESSWGTYCSPDDKVDGKSIGSCLGDLFSVNWMEDADKAKMNIETLESQFTNTKKETQQSHVLQWGQTTWTSEPIGDFEGDGAKKVDWWNKLKYEGKQALKDAVEWDGEKTDRKNTFAVDSRDVKLHYFYSKVMNDPSEKNQKALQEEIDHRIKVDKTFATIFPHHMEALKNKTTPSPTDFDCYRTLIAKVEEKCQKFDDYSLKYMAVLAAECEAIKAFPSAIDSTFHRINKHCSEKTE